MLRNFYKDFIFQVTASTRQICFVALATPQLFLLGRKTQDQRSIGYKYKHRLPNRENTINNWFLQYIISLFQLFRRRCFSLCLQWEKNSDLRFRVASSGSNRIKYFSIVHNLQKFVTGLQADFTSFLMLHSSL